MRRVMGQVACGKFREYEILATEVVHMRNQTEAA